MATVKFHLRGTGAYVWIVVIVVPLGVPALSRILVDLHPVVFAVLDLAGVLESLSKELAEIVVVGGVFEAEVADVREVLAELLGEAFAEVLDGGGLLLLTNLFVLLLVGSSLETLPRQTATEEVHEDVAEGLEIISARLFTSQVRVDTHITGGTGERFALAVWDVLLRLGVSVLLGHAKVNDVNNVGGLGSGTADDEVVGLDVSVDEVALVYGLDAREHLLGNHDDSLDGESATAVVEEVFERRSEEVNNENVVETLLAEVVDIGNTGCDGISGIVGGKRLYENGQLTVSYENLVGAVLVPQLGSVTLSRFLSWALARRGRAATRNGIRGASGLRETDEFDGDLLVVEQVGAFKDDTERALTNLLAHPVVDTDDVGGGRGHVGRV